MVTLFLSSYFIDRSFFLSRSFLLYKSVLLGRSLNSRGSGSVSVTAGGAGASSSCTSSSCTSSSFAAFLGEGLLFLGDFGFLNIVAGSGSGCLRFKTFLADLAGTRELERFFFEVVGAAGMSTGFLRLFCLRVDFGGKFGLSSVILLILRIAFGVVPVAPNRPTLLLRDLRVLRLDDLKSFSKSSNPSRKLAAGSQEL